MDRENHRCGGYTLLEAAACLVVLLPVCLGVFDIFRIFQTQAVLNEAAKLTLRHLTAIDGGGIDVSPSRSADFFQWCIRRWEGVENFNRERRPDCLPVGGLLPGGAIPTACKNPAPGSACERRLVEGRADAAQRRLAPERAARAWGQEEVAAALPQANTACRSLDGPDCVVISVAPGPEEIAPAAGAPRPLDERSLTVTIRYHLPMYVLPDWFAPGGSIVTASAAGRVEAGFFDHRLFLHHSDH